jgi:hypothetical protein
MRIRWILSVLALLGICAPRSAIAQAGCPGDHGVGRQAAEAFFTSTGYRDIRQRLAITSVRTEDVRALRMPADAEACARLHSLFGDSRYTRPPYHRSYYTAGGYLFVAFRQEREPGHRFTIGRSPLVVLDRDFRVVSVT